ncbi:MULTISPECIES: conjugal transfer protein TraG N-terminal domain-containing protein [unclassified Halomonas]|uniref:conjugal transfer protein TraG N-terminal domain-containing protein n=1 Tax=unclassified Halomonas TaxID=2609666 RepID=UPI0006967201|nr:MULTISPECIES: conjugal transfer protein TraG N-terminal domain-containing protein [unclassified Halomonas]MCO7214030.1 conjugal transfer protein TraG N-terminal domain-containing protein [Halomonas sp. OfavH-34-E]
MGGLLTAPLVVFDYFANAMTLLGWIINNAIWHVMVGTGIAAVPFITLVLSEWFKARQEGDEAGTKGILTVNRIETRLYAMILAYAFTCLPLLQVQLATADIDESRSLECGTRQFAAGGWSEGAFGATESSIGGQQARIPLWWAGVHAVSHGLTAAAIHAIPCSTDFESIRMELDLHSVEDPGLQQEVGEFQRQCFGPARNRLLQEGGTIESTRAMDVDWIGSNYFQATPGYYDSFYAGRPIAGFPYDADRDVSRPNTGPGLPGYPSCQEWWSAESVGLRARLHDEVGAGFWDGFRSVFTGSDAEDYVIRRLVSPRSGAASGNLDQAVVGFRGLDGGSSFWDATVTAGSAIGGALSILPFQAGMDMLKQALPMVQGILVMAIIICLPFVMVISSYSFKVAGMATFGLFAMWFLTFWWELARWINSNLVDLLYRSDAAKLSWLSAANNLYDRMVLQFVEGMMFLALPTLWVGVLSWAGMRVGSAVGSGLRQGSGDAQSAGKSGGQKAQATSSGGKL